MYQYNPYGAYGAYTQPMQRLQQLEQQYPQYSQGYQQFPQSYPQQPQLLKGSPVTSIDEARASKIDLDGSLFIFPDVTNKKIYTKQINLDGTASLITYVQETPSNEQEGATNSFLQKSDISSLEEQIKALNSNMEELKERMNEYAKSNANYSNVKSDKR